MQPLLQQRQFWPDYSTNADSDKYWNTGKLLFNSSDAGKFIEVGYTATGTLGSIEAGSTLPGWAKYRGDGSEGDFVSDGTVSLSGVHHYTSFMVPAGVSCPIGTDPLIILCQGTVNIAGTLNGKGNTGNCSSQDDTTPEDDIKYSSRAIGVGGGGDGGYFTSTETVVCGSGTGAGGGGTGVGYGGVVLSGGKSAFVAGSFSVAAGASPTIYQQNIMAMQFPFLPKAGAGGAPGQYNSNYGGGAGGGGGGSCTLAAERVEVVVGTIDVSGGLKSTATGSSSNNMSGGGSGGASIIIIAKDIIVSGTVTCAGGDGGPARVVKSSVTNGAAGWYRIFKAGA